MTPEQLFEKQFNCSISAGIDRIIMGKLQQPWSQVGSANVSSIPMDRQETVNINIPLNDYMKLIDKLHEIHVEETIRQNNSECQKLYYEYKMWINLHK